MYPKKQPVRYLRANLKRTPAKQTESLAKTKPTKKPKSRLKNQTQTGFYFGSGLGQLFKPRMEKVNNNNWPVSWHHCHCVCECVCVPRHVQ